MYCDKVSGPFDTLVERVIMKTSTRRHGMIRLIIGIALGAVAGFAYYKFIGCASGACPITGNPVISTIYGAVMGALLSGAFTHS
jgi:hypothetical protein